MEELTERMRRHHRALLEALQSLESQATQLAEKGELGTVVDFLLKELLPHAKAEEDNLYRAVDELLRRKGGGTKTMAADHDGMRRYAERIEALARKLSSPGRAAHGAAELRQLLSELRAIFALHLEKEERYYLPLVGKELPPSEQQSILFATEEAVEAARSGKRILDVRSLPPAKRHERIFATFFELKDGESFVLVNDHDPKPLYYQFAAEQPGKFRWEYLEQGPERWRVRIGKVKGT